MSLRMRLTWALVLAALGPMLIVVGATLLRTEKRAEQDASERLEAAKRQTRILLDRYRDEALRGLEESATDLSHEFFGALESLIGEEIPSSDAVPGAPREPHGVRGGPGAPTPPLEIARTLADRRGLDYLEVLDGQGRILTNSQMDAPAGLL